MMIRRNGVVVIGALACGVGMAFAVGARAQEAEAASPPKVEEAVKAAPEAAPLIPREVFFGNPDKASVQLSPDGKQISYLAPVEGVLNVWVSPADKPADAKPVTDDTHRGIRSYFWAQTSQHVLYIQDKGGDENWHLYSVNLEDNKTIDLTPFDGVQARVQQVSHQHPEEVLVAINNRDPQYHDIHRVHVATGESSLVQENTGGYIGFLTENDMRIHFALKITEDGGTEVHRRTGDDSWSLLLSIPAEDSLTTQPLMLDESGKGLFMIDSRGRDKAALTRLDIHSGKSKVLAMDRQADIAGIVGHPTKNIVQAVQSNHMRRRWNVLDDSIKKDFEVLGRVAEGDFSINSRTQDDSQWIVAYVMDTGPVRYYRYDRATRKAEFLFTNRPALEKLPLAKMHPKVVATRDGLEMVCYYTLPTWTDPDSDGKPDKPLPTVMFIHGGPWGRDSWGYHPYHQWLANRGYAVMSVNYRGSTGFGKKFINAGNFEWAGKMHDDLIDAADWLVKSGIADEERIGIMGGSYGGYAVLVGLTFTPEKFACGVDIVGPSNLITLLESVPPYWKPMIAIFTKRVGDHRTEEGRKLLTERSPLTHADKICRPLLIGQGANDPRVKQAESDQIVAAMKKSGIPVTYVLYPDEGHGFHRPENNLSFNAVTEAFLAKYLGGRHEPMSEPVGSTIQILSGAEDIPGLPPSLATKSSEKGPA